MKFFAAVCALFFVLVVHGDEFDSTNLNNTGRTTCGQENCCCCPHTNIVCKAKCTRPCDKCDKPCEKKPEKIVESQKANNVHISNPVMNHHNVTNNVTTIFNMNSVVHNNNTIHIPVTYSSHTENKVHIIPPSQPIVKINITSSCNSHNIVHNEEIETVTVTPQNVTTTTTTTATLETTTTPNRKEKYSETNSTCCIVVPPIQCQFGYNNHLICKQEPRKMCGKICVSPFLVQHPIEIPNQPTSNGVFVPFMQIIRRQQQTCPLMIWNGYQYPTCGNIQDSFQFQGTKTPFIIDYSCHDRVIAREHKQRTICNMSPYFPWWQCHRQNLQDCSGCILCNAQYNPHSCMHSSQCSSTCYNVLENMHFKVLQNSLHCRYQNSVPICS